MKVLIVNTSDIRGGAARAAYRLHEALLAANIESQMLVKNKYSNDETVIAPKSNFEHYYNKINQMLNNLPIKFYKDRTKTYFSASISSSYNIVKKINEINPDIVHLHWIGGGLISIEDIAKIKAPIVWSLHDMWAFTGGCHYDEECKGYEKECGNCKVLGSDKEKDLSRKIFNRKQKVFSQKKDIIIVGLSSWLNESSKNSTLLKDKKHINLPNPIDTNLFKPYDKNSSREFWDLPKNKKLILYGAMGATSDPRKGFKELSEALQKLEKSDDIELVVFGSDRPQNSPEFGFKTTYVGNVSDDISLIKLYSTVDVMIVPSLQENLSNAIMESLSCGIPVVGFNIGGNNDMIKHEQNGYLAKSYDATDLKDGIEWILNSPNYDELSTNARDKVKKEFNSKIVVKKYVKFYNEVVNNDNF